MSGPNPATLVLSLFPGADLLGRGFEADGFCVVRGPDKIWGQDIRDFTAVSHKFGGIIGGSPCQGFSKARIGGKRGDAAWDFACEMLEEFARVIHHAQPEWFLSENVPTVPDFPPVEGYTVQRFNLSAKECGGRQARLRCFQFGSKDGIPLVIHRSTERHVLSPAPMASEAHGLPLSVRRRGIVKRRSWSEFCQLQGLPPDFDMPGLSTGAKYKAVGNGVPVYMARVIAGAIKARHVTRWQQQLCVCLCGRPVKPGTTLATAACRKRMQRKRDAVPRLVTGPVTEESAASLLFADF